MSKDERSKLCKNEGNKIKEFFNDSESLSMKRITTEQMLCTSSVFNEINNGAKPLDFHLVKLVHDEWMKDHD